MIDKFEPIQNKEKTKEFIELTNWIWNSHWWVEYSPGYYKCKWCEMQHTSEMGISKNYPLCKENPAIKKLLNGNEEKRKKLYKCALDHAKNGGLNYGLELSKKTLEALAYYV